MNSAWQGGFPKTMLWEQVRAPMSGSCSEPYFGVTFPCLGTGKEKLAGEAEILLIILILRSISIPISFFETGASGKSKFKTKLAATFRLLSFPRGTPMASAIAGAGGLVCFLS